MNTIVFFGRFEIRKGIEDFLQALQYLASSTPDFVNRYKIVFLGTEVQYSRTDIKKALANFNLEFLCLPREKAINFLVNNARLVAIPSKTDNFPNTILECMTAGIPFITSRFGGIPEIIGSEGTLYDSIVCDTTNPQTFAAGLQKYLSYDDQQLCGLIELARQRVKAVTDEGAIVNWYEKLRARHQERNSLPAPLHTLTHQDPAVTVLIPYFKMPQYIGSTLDSLHLQTYQNFKIILVNGLINGQTEPQSVSVLNDLRHKYPAISILDQESHGIGAARNLALPYIDSKYLIAVDADNIAKPEMIETFITAIEHQKGTAALSCYSTVFTDQDESAVLQNLTLSNPFEPSSYYKPLGACLPVLFFENTQGDTNSIYLVEALKSVGGWSERRTGHQDWALWLNLIANGYHVDVIPRILFYYRVHPAMETNKQKLIDGDETNFEYIRSLLEKRPADFSRVYFQLHRLIRGFNRNVPQSALIYSPSVLERAIRYYRIHGLIPTFKRTVRYLRS